MEVAVSGFRAPESLAPAAQALRRTTGPDIDAGGGSGGGAGGMDIALAEMLYGDAVDDAAAGAGDCGSVAAREAMLQRSSDEALRAAAEARVANRAKERGLWERHQMLRAARQASRAAPGWLTA